MAGSYGAVTGRAGAACLFLLFAPDARPDSDTVARAIERAGRGCVSHDPRTSLSHNQICEAWLELLVDGLTFDLLGLAPLQAVHWPTPRHYFGIAAEEISGCEAIVIAPGPHLSGAANAIPVVRSMMGLAAGLMLQLDGAVGAIWQPSASAIGNALFGRIIGQWLDGGVFPALGLTGVYATGNGCLASDGLAFFTGREIEIAPDLSSNPTLATQLAVRIIDHLVNGEADVCDRQIAGLDNRPLRLTPMPGGKRLRVSTS